jgi:hypothetical protein
MHRNDFVEIMEMLDKRLNDKGKNWRHVFKVRIPSNRAQHLPTLRCPRLVPHRSRLPSSCWLRKRRRLLPG